jgi:thiamine-phosphate pyrophosphorylase
LPAARNHPIVCYVTDRNAIDSSVDNPNPLAKIRAAIAAGVDWVQIREKDLAGRELLDLARGAIGIAREIERTSAGREDGPVFAAEFARIFVNDRIDVALAAGAAGVHLGHDSAPVREVIRWLRAGNASADFRIGVSCHSVEEVRKAEDAGASYAFFGPVFDTPSKRHFGLPQGVSRLEEVCCAVKIPVLAIGGVNEDNAEECLRAGATGIAAIRLFQQEEPFAGALKATIARLHQNP